MRQAEQEQPHPHPHYGHHPQLAKITPIGADIALSKSTPAIVAIDADDNVLSSAQALDQTMPVYGAASHTIPVPLPQSGVKTGSFTITTTKAHGGGGGGGGGGRASPNLSHSTPNGGLSELSSAGAASASTSAGYLAVGLSSGLNLSNASGGSSGNMYSSYADADEVRNLPRNHRPPTLSLASLDWTLAHKIELRKASGECTSLADICKAPNVGHKTMLVFLKRFDTQSGYIYSLMFSFIKHVLARRDVSIIFISCHPDMSELTLFVRHYAQWLQSNTSEGLRPALTNFYIDQSREAYLFFGLCSRIESIRSLQMSIMMRMKSRKWRRAIKSRQRATAKARAKVGPRPSAVDYNPFGPQSQQSQQHQQPHPQHPTSGKVAPAPTLMVRKSDPSDPSAAALTDTDMDILSDDIGAGVMAGLTNSVCNKSVWQMVKDFMACKMTAALGSQQAKVDMLWQTPGVCVVQDGRVIYMHEFQDYSRRAAAAISGMSMDASGTKKKHDFPHTPTDHLGEFINTITADDADADADVDAAASGSGNNSGGSIANPTTLNSLSQSPQSTDKSQVSPSTSLVASPLPATSPPPPPSNKYPELSLGERIGQGRESEVFVSHLNGKIVAVKYFRRPSPASPTGGGGGGPTSSGIGTLKPKGLQPANMSGAGGPKVGSPAIMLGLRSMARSGKGVMDAGDTLASFSNEVAMLMALRHTNVVKFVGFGSLDSRHFLLTEFMGRGSVFDLLASKDHLDSRRKWRIIMDAATGMEYLHGCRPSIIHQDLKSLNLLVADDWTVKVADFGIALELTPANLAARSRSIANHRSRNKLSEDDGGGGGGGGGGPIKSAGDLSNTNGLGTNNKEMDGGGGHGGTLQWMAPELLTGRPVMPSSKIDVFAFGVILWEVATRKKPWRGVNTRVITESILAGSRLPKSENWVMDLRMLVDACWNQDQSLRPEFKSIRQSLKTIVFPST